MFSLQPHCRSTAVWVLGMAENLWKAMEGYIFDRLLLAAVAAGSSRAEVSHP